MRAARRHSSFARRSSVLARRRSGFVRPRSSFARRRSVASRSQRGFALLMALVVLALAVAALAALARRSVVAALDAQGAAEEMKRRWAVASCRETLLGQAERMLDEAERGGQADADGPYRNAPMAALRVQCVLADINYELVLTDEQAKLNPNSLLANRSRSETEAILSRLSGVSRGVRGAKMSVKLRTMPLTLSSDASAERLPAVGGYGQVFQNAPPELLVGDGWRVGAAAEVTCWSDGKLNVRRASSGAIEMACEKAVEPRLVRALLAARKKNPYADLQTMMADAGEINAAGMAKLVSRVTDRSSCHGLWVIARAQQRAWYTFSAYKGGGETVSQRGEDASGGAARAVSRGRRYDFSW